MNRNTWVMSVGIAIICALLGSHRAQAVLLPGAPLIPSQDVTVTIGENKQEGIAQVTIFATATETGQPNINMIVPRNPNGTFTLPVPLQPGSVVILDAGRPGGIPSDTIVLIADPMNAMNTIISNFASDILSEPSPEPTGAERGESLTVAGTGNPPGSTRFVVNSPAEPIPEPSTLIILVTAFGTFLVTCAMVRRRGQFV